MRDRSKAKNSEIQKAKNREANINGLRLSGHAFRYFEGIVRCVGCGLSAQADWKSGSYLYGEVARGLVKKHGDCAHPWNLEKRLAEIEAQYAPKPQKKKGKEVTLETLNAKLDKIMLVLGIR